jgi:hypothetical protein
MDSAMIDTASAMTYEDAVARLPDSKQLHTFLPFAFGMAGADMTRTRVLKALRAAERICPADPKQSLGHEVAIFHEGRWLLIETRPAGDAG